MHVLLAGEIAAAAVKVLLLLRKTQFPNVSELVRANQGKLLV